MGLPLMDLIDRVHPIQVQGTTGGKIIEGWGKVNLIEEIQLFCSQHWSKMTISSYDD